MIIIDNILRYCSIMDISETRFEAMCGLGNGNIQNWKRRKVRGPSMRSLELIAEGTGIPISTWTIKGGIDAAIRAKD